MKKQKNDWASVAIENIENFPCNEYDKKQWEAFEKGMERLAKK